MLNKNYVISLFLILVYYYISVYFIKYFEFDLLIFNEYKINFTRIIFFSGILIITFSIFNYLLLSSYKSVSSIFFTFQFLFVLVPACAVVTIVPKFRVEYIILLSFAYMLTVFLTAFTFRYVKILQIGKLAKYLIISPLVFWVLYASVVFVSEIINGSFSITSVLSFDVIYEYRKEVFSNLSAIKITSLSSLGYFLFPLLFILYFHTKRLIYNICLIILIFFLYAVTGIKTYLIIPFFTLIIYQLRTHSVNYFFCKLSLLVILIVILIACVSLFFESPIPASLVYRSFIIPGQLHVIYFDHFINSKIPSFIYFNNSDLNVAQLIQQEVFGGAISDGEGANTGIYGSAFAHHGLIGIIKVAIFLGIILGLVDRYAKGVRYIYMYSFIPAFYMSINIDFFGVFFYYGLFFCILLIIFNYNKSKFVST